MNRDTKISPLLPLLLCAWSLGAHAAEQSFELGGKQVNFFRSEEKHLTVSRGCLKSNGSLSCQAYESLSKASLDGLESKNSGGANPGARICDSELKGEVVIGRDKSGNENSFCRFSDGSLVSSGTLMYYGRQNDTKTR